MATGFDSTVLDRQSYLAEVQSVIYFNNWLFNEAKATFNYVGPGQSTNGTKIPFFIDYSMSSSAATYDYDDAMVTSSSKETVEAYFNKVGFQDAARVYNMQQAMQSGIGAPLEVSRDKVSDALNSTAAGLRDLMTTTAITALIAQIDNAGNFSDAAISRATYNLDSAETAVGGALTLAAINLMVQEMESPAHMAVNRNDMILMMNGNVHGDLVALAPGASTSSVLIANADGTSNIDMGLAPRVQTYGGIPIMIVPDMPDTDMLCVDKNTIVVNEWRAVEIEDKSTGVMADQGLWGMFAGAQIYTKNPKRCGKLSGLT